MKQFSYLDNVDFAATVCDREGKVLYQNARAVRRDGDVIGKNLYGCHSPASCEMIRRMIETGMGNTYTIIRKGHRRLIHQTPWREDDGSVAGLIELSIGLPDDMVTLDKDS